MVVPIRTVMDGLVWPACVRWAHGVLWCADAGDHRVLRISHHRPVPVAVAVTFLAGDQPGGLAWTEQGELLVTALDSRFLMRMSADGRLVRHADLSALATGSLREVAMGPDGTVFVADLGMPLLVDGVVRHGGRLLRVGPDGSVEVAAEELEAPTGMVVTDEGAGLVVAESAAGRLTTFRIGPAGRLDRRRVLAEIPPAPGTRAAAPGALATDPGGRLWCVEPIGRRIVAIGPDGGFEEFGLPEGLVPLSCAIDGDDGATIHVGAASAERVELGVSRRPSGVLLSWSVAGDGLPAPELTVG